MKIVDLKTYYNTEPTSSSFFYYNCTNYCETDYIAGTIAVPPIEGAENKLPLVH